MKARFAEFNGRISIIAEADSEEERLLMSLFLKQQNEPGLLPLRIVSNGSRHTTRGDGTYGEVSRSVHFAQYTQAEVDSYKNDAEPAR